MKKILLVLFLSISCIVSAQRVDRILMTESKFAAKTAGNTTDMCRASVAGFSVYPPFGWVEDTAASYEVNRKYVSKGVLIDIFQKIIAQTGIKRTQLSSVGYPSFQESYANLQKGHVDFFLGLYYDQTMYHPEIRFIYPSLLQNPFLVVFLKGKERTIHSFDDLKGLSGVVRQEELVYPLIYKKVPASTKLMRVSGAQQAYLKLLSGQVDFMITSQYANEAEMRRFKLIDKLFVPSTALFKAEMFIVANKNSPCYEALREQIKDVLKAYKKENFIEKQLLEGIDRWGILFKDEPALEVPVTEEYKDKDNQQPVLIQPA